MLVNFYNTLQAVDPAPVENPEVPAEIPEVPGQVCFIMPVVLSTVLAVLPCIST